MTGQGKEPDVKSYAPEPVDDIVPISCCCCLYYLFCCHLFCYNI